MDKDIIINELLEIIAWMKELPSNNSTLNNNSVLDLIDKLVELVSRLQAYILTQALDF